jgi:hypothetical protein
MRDGRRGRPRVHGALHPGGNGDGAHVSALVRRNQSGTVLGRYRNSVEGWSRDDAGCFTGSRPLRVVAHRPIVTCGSRVGDADVRPRVAGSGGVSRRLPGTRSHDPRLAPRVVARVRLSPARGAFAPSDNRHCKNASTRRNCASPRTINVVEALTAQRADQSVDVRILPRTAGRAHDFADADAGHAASGTRRCRSRHDPSGAIEARCRPERLQ